MFSWMVSIILLFSAIFNPDMNNAGYMILASGLFAIAGNIADYHDD